VTGAECPVYRCAAECGPSQGGSSIPLPGVTEASCDCRVNRVAGEEGEGSHPAKRATQQRGGQPQQRDQGQTGQNYHYSHVVLCYRGECVTTGRDPGPEGDPRRGKEEEGVRCQLGCSSTVQGDLTVGSRRGKARQKPRSTNTEDGDRVTIFRMPTVLTEQHRRGRNTREQGHQGNYFTDSAKLVTALTMEGELPTVQIAKRDASPSPK